MSRRILPAALALTLALAGAVSAAELLQVEPFIPATPGEAGKFYPTRGATRVQVIADRVEYLQEDLNGQFLVTFLGAMNAEGDATAKIALSLKDAAGKEIASKVVEPVKSPKLPLLIPVSELKPGKYTLSAALMGKDGAMVKGASVSFGVSDRKTPHPAFPKGGVAINVHPQGFVPDASWPISTGVPMPAATLKDTSSLALLENGKPIPAQFSVRATWSPNGYVKWVGVDFVAKYDQGKPREYRLVQDASKRIAPARPLSVKESADRIVVDTGAIKFEIGRKPFAGIEKVWVDHGGNGAYADQDLIVNGPGGPFIVDGNGTRYDSAHCRDVKVVVEESGPVSALIAAKGWYHSESDRPLCQFVLRFKVFAGQPSVTLSYRMINTIFDQLDPTRLADVGFETVMNGRLAKWGYGFDGKSQEGDAPAAPASIYLHQDRADHFRLMNGEASLGEGKRSDGWMTGSAATGCVTYFVRDIWQKFPKELEADLGADNSKLVAHFWPKHGHVAFTEQEELALTQVYKARFAEEGKVLNFLIPDDYITVLKKSNDAEHWDDGYNMKPHTGDWNGAAKGHVGIQNASGQGTVVGGDLVLWFQPKPVESAQLTARAALVQQSPHALADPAWNCATRALGPLAPRDPAKFGPAEKLMDDAYVFLRRGVIDAGDEYGMWTYGDVHEVWLPEKLCAGLYRVWQHGHYQNVFQSWLLYFRSGTPDALEWARIHSSNHLDVGVNNYAAYPPGKHAYSAMGDMGGGPHHWGLLPWSGTVSEMHWFDLTNYFIQYDLTGDRRGLDLAEQYMHSRGVMNFPARPVVMDPSGKPNVFYPRDVFVPLGEWTQYYESTWNPQALLYVDQYAEYLNEPIMAAGEAAPLAEFGKHWHEWYFALTRDPRAPARVKEYLTSNLMWERHPSFMSLAAFVYHSTGDKSFIEPIVSKMYGHTLDIYECPDDPQDGFCCAASNPAAMLLGRLPYFLDAVDAAGLKFENSGASSSIPTRGGRMDASDSGLSEPRGWSNAGLTILAVTPKDSRILLSVDGPRTSGDLNSFYQVFYGFPEINVFARGDYKAIQKQLDEQQRQSRISLEVTDSSKPAPTGRHLSTDYIKLWPNLDRVSNDPAKHEYRLEYDGMQINLPVFLSADTEQPLPQVAVIGRMTGFERKIVVRPSSSKGMMDAWFRPLNDKAVVTLTIESVHQRYSVPTKFRISDARGAVIKDSSVFMAGKRPKIDVPLDPAKNPLPWRIMVASDGDNKITFTGADELFFALNKSDFDAVLPRIPIYKK